MTPYVPTWKERLEELKLYTGPLLAGLLVLGVASWVVWHEWGSPAAGRSGETEAQGVAAQARVSADVDTLEKTYRRAIESGATADAASLLDRAIEKQRQRLQRDPAANPEQDARLARLEALRAGTRANAATARSVALETEARAAQESGQTAVVVDKLREALRLQREANTNAATSGARDFTREAQLAQTIELAETEPLHAAAENALVLAHAAAALEQWDDALKAYTDARAAQAKINQEHPTTRYANLGALDAIDREIESLQATGLTATITARDRDGDAAAAAGRASEAAASYAAALELQRQLNEKFPRSRLASTARTEELAAKRDTLASAPLIARASGLDREIESALARRQLAAARDKIGEAAGLVEQAARNFPRSRSLDRALQLKLGYLALRRGELDELQREVYARLLPVPGAKGAQMLKTEVTQGLYSQVMNANPSRRSDRALPVDSVSWREAQEFCQRLSWLLGLRVRLPTEGEMRAAFAVSPEAWSAETSGGQTHATGQSPATGAGFFDLAGNVAEWLQPAAGSDESAPVGGGSYLDPAGALATLTITPVDKRERAPHIGFRVVVEAAAK